ncbi:hypothetical protein [Ulvibacterium marinum]|uniref:Uncharacterized protein n=1 Tax=Ulvibacterium marinum TaxID=2419782 RepID=A0A3B0CDT3_9FLAO|nr:hypothetical protein [Ulvibacterium marinum]RKN83500.1 hypothetical protein D7Z94_06695 [Ulvibacterium marinum]
MEIIVDLGIIFGSLTIVGALHFLLRMFRHKIGVNISTRTFALFFALNAFLANAELFSARWALFTICSVSCVLNGVVLIKDLGQYS